MSARVSIATPHRADLAERHRVVGVAAHAASACRTPSTARRRPAAMISLKRQFVSSAVPKPANIRIVHSFDRYIDAYGPAGVRVLAGELAVVGP